MMRIVLTALALTVVAASFGPDAIASCGKCGSDAPAQPSPAASGSPGQPAEHKHYDCEKCCVSKEEPGKCEKCGEELKEKVVEQPAASPSPSPSPASK